VFYFVIRVYSWGELQFAHNGAFLSMAGAVAEMAELTALSAQVGEHAEYRIYSASELNALPNPNAVRLFGYFVSNPNFAEVN